MFAGFDFRAEAGVPAGVAGFDNIREAAVLADCSRDFESACEGIHPADVGVKKISRFERFATDLRVKVQAAGFEPAHFEDAEHDGAGEVEAARELVGIPADEFVAGVGINGAEFSRGSGDFAFVVHGVAGESGVIGFEVELEVLQKVVFPQEIQAGGCVAVVLVTGWLLRFRLDVERALEADLFFVVHSHVEKFCQVVDLALHVGIPECRVAFASAPEDIAFAAEFMRDFERLLHLRGGVGEDVGVRACRRAVEESRIRKQTRCAPEELDAGAVLFFLEHLDDGIEIFVRLGETRALGSDIPVVKGVERCPQFFDKFKGHPRSFLRVIDRVRSVIPGPQHRAGSEGIGSGSTESMPIHHRKAEVFAHRLSIDQLVGIVMLESERVF